MTSRKPRGYWIPKAGEVDGTLLCTPVSLLATKRAALGQGQGFQTGLLGVPEKVEDLEHPETRLGRWTPAGVTWEGMTIKPPRNKVIENGPVNCWHQAFCVPFMHSGLENLYYSPSVEHLGILGLNATLPNLVLTFVRTLNMEPISE